MSILIVDDDVGIRQLLALFLTHKGYSAVSVANGAEALDHLQHSPAHPELILLDLMMPVMDGSAFCHHQQRHPQLAKIPVVVLSAAADMQEQPPTLQTAAYLPKPIDFDSLLAVVEQHCQQSRQYQA